MATNSSNPNDIFANPERRLEVITGQREHSEFVQAFVATLGNSLSVRRFDVNQDHGLEEVPTLRGEWKQRLGRDLHAVAAAKPASRSNPNGIRSSERVSAARRVLGRDNNMYLQTGVMLLWASDCDNADGADSDIANPFFPASLSSSLTMGTAWQRSVARVVAGDMLRQTRQRHNQLKDALQHSAHVLAVLISDPHVDAYLCEAWKIYTKDPGQSKEASIDDLFGRTRRRGPQTPSKIRDMLKVGKTVPPETLKRLGWMSNALLQLYEEKFVEEFAVQQLRRHTSEHCGQEPRGDLDELLQNFECRGGDTFNVVQNYVDPPSMKSLSGLYKWSEENKNVTAELPIFFPFEKRGTTFQQIQKMDRENRNGDGDDVYSLDIIRGHVHCDLHGVDGDEFVALACGRMGLYCRTTMPGFPQTAPVGSTQSIFPSMEEGSNWKLQQIDAPPANLFEPSDSCHEDEDTRFLEVEFGNEQIQNTLFDHRQKTHDLDPVRVSPENGAPNRPDQVLRKVTWMPESNESILTPAAAAAVRTALCGALIEKYTPYYETDTAAAEAAATGAKTAHICQRAALSIVRMHSLAGMAMAKDFGLVKADLLGKKEDSIVWPRDLLKEDEQGDQRCRPGFAGVAPYSKFITRNRSYEYDGLYGGSAVQSLIYGYIGRVGNDGRPEYTDAERRYFPRWKIDALVEGQDTAPSLTAIEEVAANAKLADGVADDVADETPSAFVRVTPSSEKPALMAPLTWLTPEALKDMLRRTCTLVNAVQRTANELAALERMHDVAFQNDQQGHQAEGPTVRTMDGDGRERRMAVWSDAMRELSITGDPLYSFVRHMAGQLHDDVNAIVRLEDRSMDQSTRRRREQQREALRAETTFHNRVLADVMSAVVKDTKLRLDVRDPTGSASSITSQTVVVNSETVARVRELAQGQSGLPFFQANQELESALEKARSNPTTLGTLLQEVRSVLGESSKRRLAEAVGGEGGFGDSSEVNMEYLMQPRVAYLIRMRNEAFASIRTAYDTFERQWRSIYGPDYRPPSAYVLMEGENRTVCDDFATLCAYMHSQSRMHSSSASAYLSITAAKANVIQVRQQLDRLVTSVAQYLGGSDRQMTVGEWEAERSGKRVRVGEDAPMGRGWRHTQLQWQNGRFRSYY